MCDEIYTRSDSGISSFETYQLLFLIGIFENFYEFPASVVLDKLNE